MVHPGAGAYICGEETALLESLEGKRGFPRIKPPYFPAAIGLYGEPTVVNNVETISTLPWIVENGGDAFAALGARTSTGTRLFALSGRVARPGWYELEMSKTTFRDLIFDPTLGGGVAGGGELKAFIPGGVSAPWFGPDQLDLGLDQDAVGPGGIDARLGVRRRPGRDELRRARRLAHHPLLLPGVLWPVHALPGRRSLAREGPPTHRGGGGSLQRPRPRDGRLRQPRARGELAARTDDGLRVRAVDPVVDRLGDPDVPRRVHRARPDGRVPARPSRWAGSRAR